MNYLKPIHIISLFFMFGLSSNLSLAKSLMPNPLPEVKCPAQSVLNKETGFCKGKEESFCPLNQNLNSLSTACINSCATNEKPYGGQCLHVCTGDKIQGISGLVCPDGKPGVSLEKYNNLIKLKK